jgi:hypothetical protein
MTADRQCSRCSQILPVSEFYRKSGRKDAWEGRCKACFNALLSIQRSSDEVRDSRAERRRKNRLTTNLPVRDRRHVAAYRIRYPQKEASKRALNRAIESGDVVRPETCERCGTKPSPRSDGAASIHGHHDDYSKPLDVKWLCGRCHTDTHRALAEKEPRSNADDGDPEIHDGEWPNV